MTAVMLMLARSIQWKYIVGALDDRKYVYIKYDRRVHSIRVTLIIVIIIYYFFFLLLFFITTQNKNNDAVVYNNVEHTHSVVMGHSTPSKRGLWQQQYERTTKIVVPLSIPEGIVDSCRTSDNVPEIRI